MTKIALIGAAGQIGTPLSLLCKASDLFSSISLYDLVHVPGIATDLNHIDTRAVVTGHLPSSSSSSPPSTPAGRPPSGLRDALQDAELVVVSAGIARKPGMTRDDLFQTNASIVRDVFSEVAITCPAAICCLVTNPVNSLVPVAAETLRRAGVQGYAERLFGVTTLDVVRASAFAAQAAVASDASAPSFDPSALRVPVVGGHSGDTILPLYSQAEPPVRFLLANAEIRDAVIHRVQYGGDEIVQSKKGAGSATTCMAYAAFRFVKAIMRARNGTDESPVLEEAYVYLPGIESGKEIALELGVDFFAVKVHLGSQGAAEKVLRIGELSEDENRRLGVAIAGVRANVQSGLQFVL